MVVPAWRLDSGSIATGVTQAAVGPGRPGGLHLDLWQTLKYLCILLRRRHGGQFRRMPGAANHGDAAEALLFSGTDRLSHKGLPAGFVHCVWGFRVPFKAGTPQTGHRLQNGIKEISAVPAVFYQGFPPPLPVGSPGGFGKPAEWITTNLL